MVQVALAVFLLGLGCAIAATPGSIIAESNFRSSGQVWSPSGKVVSGGKGLETDFAQGVIKMSDTGNYTWYFKTPSEFNNFWSGDKADGVNGVLRIWLQHLEWSGDFVTDNDVIINCKKPSMRMGIKDIVKDGDTAKEYVIPLNTSAAWRYLAPTTVHQSGEKRYTPTTEEFVRCMQDIQSFEIRGGFYTGAEKTQLRRVRVFQGAVDQSEYEVAYELKYGAALAAAAEPSCCSELSCTTSDKFELHFTKPGVCSDANKLLANTRQVRYYCDQKLGTIPPTNLDFKFEQVFALKSVPHICSVATLTIGLTGPVGKDMIDPQHYLTVYGEHHEVLGHFFKDIKAEPLMLQGGSEYQDTITISAEQMSGMSSDGQIELELRSNSPTNTPAIKYFKLRFSGGHCFSAHIYSAGRVEAIDDGRAHAFSFNTTFTVPKVPPASDGILQVGVDGTVGQHAWLGARGADGTELGVLFKDFYSTARSSSLVKGSIAYLASDTSVVLESTASATDNYYTGLWFALRGSDGVLQNSVKITAYVGASRTLTLEHGVESKPSVQQPQFVIHDLEDYPLTTVSGSVVPRGRNRHKEYVRIPMATLAKWTATGKVSTELYSDFNNMLSEASLGPVFLKYRMTTCHSDGIYSGQFLGVGLIRPSNVHLTFAKKAPAPAGDATFLFEITFQDHQSYIKADAWTSRLSNGDHVATPVDIRDHPFGLGAIPVKAGYMGETLGHILREDYSQWATTRPYLAQLIVSKTRMEQYTSDGVVDLSLVLPPGLSPLHSRRRLVACSPPQVCPPLYSRFRVDTNVGQVGASIKSKSITWRLFREHPTPGYPSALASRRHVVALLILSNPFGRSCHLASPSRHSRGERERKGERGRQRGPPPQVVVALMFTGTGLLIIHRVTMHYPIAAV